jgi:hypothetical protein
MLAPLAPLFFALTAPFVSGYEPSRDPLEETEAMFSEIYIANLNPVDGKVYHIISSQQTGEVCTLYLREDIFDRAYKHKDTLARQPESRPIIVFLPNSKSPLVLDELWLDYECPAYDNLIEY